MHPLETIIRLNDEAVTAFGLATPAPRAVGSLPRSDAQRDSHTRMLALESFVRDVARDNATCSCEYFSRLRRGGHQPGCVQGDALSLLGELDRV